MKITHKKVDCYTVKVAGGDFANITIEPLGEESGRLSIVSSFGTWSYYWGSCGCSFVDFLKGLDAHYTAGKFGEGGYVFMDKTIERWRAEVHEDALANDALASSFLVELKAIESECIDSAFTTRLAQSDLYWQVHEKLSAPVTGVSPRFQAFWDLIWVPFVAQLEPMNVPSIELEFVNGAYKGNGMDADQLLKRYTGRQCHIYSRSRQTYWQKSGGETPNTCQAAVFTFEEAWRLCCACTPTEAARIDFVCERCGGSGFDPYPNHSTTHAVCPQCGA